MRVYATELIYSTGVLGFHTFKLALCIYNKLPSHAEILSWWAFDVTFPGSSHLRSNRSGLNVSYGGSWNPKFTLKVNSFWIKIKGQYFASQVLSRHTFKISRKKRKWFFWSQGHFKQTNENSLFAVIQAIPSSQSQEVKWKCKQLRQNRTVYGFIKPMQPMQCKLKILPSILFSPSGFSRRETHCLCIGMIPHRSQVHQNMPCNRSFTSSFSLSLSSGLGTRLAQNRKITSRNKHACQDSCATWRHG